MMKRAFLNSVFVAVFLACLAGNLLAETPIVHGNVVRDVGVRIEVLTPTLMRMEYAEDGQFEDRTTFTVINRDFPKTHFKVRRVNGELTITTEKMAFSYTLRSGPFGPRNTKVSIRNGSSALVARLDFNGAGETCDSANLCHAHTNLGGWYQSLDGREGPVKMSPGILSRDGWELLNDTASALNAQDGWPKPRSPHKGEYQDGYLFGYGLDYAGGLKELAELTGKSPLLPKWAFGVWLGLCCNFTAKDYMNDIVPKASANGFEFDVLTVDTQWKEEYPSRGKGNSNGWAWRSSTYPDPDAFLRWADANGLHVGLNIHPSIHPADPQYKATVLTAGELLPDPMRPNSKTWDLGRPSHALSYFSLHDQVSQGGVRFWWFDGCCGEGVSSLKGVTPNTWINSLYAAREEKKGLRPVVLARIGGTDKTYGNDGITETGPWADHRYAVHFTGDTTANWKTLEFETTFTAKEDAIGIIYVSHDIGAFHGGHLNDDLYLRWIQAGVFSPIMRLHGDHGDRLPWQYGDNVRQIASRFLSLRDELVPYVYTSARKAHDSGVSIARPLYIDYPGSEAAYHYDREYLFGDQMLVAPVLAPGADASVTMWIPPGVWYDFFNGERYSGPHELVRKMPLDRLPVLVKAGSIVPMNPDGVHASGDARRMRVRVYPGSDSQYDLYDDAGEGLGYLKGDSSWQKLQYHEEPGKRVLRITPPVGAFQKADKSREWEVSFEQEQAECSIVLNRKALAHINPGEHVDGAWYTPESRTWHVRVSSISRDGRQNLAIVVRER